MILDSKNIESIEKSDLEGLINDQTRENQKLEYKAQMYSQLSIDRIEMLKDITAMANAEGGYLIIGIEEDSEGIPVKLLGLENGEVVKDNILKSCNSSIEEKILGLKIKPVDIGNSKSVLTLQIPRSTRKPHMVTFDKHNKFYKRHDRHNFHMSLNEVKNAVLEVTEYMKKHIYYLEQRKLILKKEFIMKMIIVIYCTPLMIGQDIIDCKNPDIKNSVKNPNYSEFGLDVWMGDLPQLKPSLYGVTLEKFDRSIRLELHRNGHAELIFSSEHPKDKERPYVKSSYMHSVTQYLMIFVSLIKSIYQLSGVNTDLSFSINFYNFDYWSLGQIEFISEFHEEKVNLLGPWKMEDLEIPPEVINDISECEPRKIAKALMDRFYNAFGKEQSPDFTQDGKFVPRH